MAVLPRVKQKIFGKNADLNDLGIVGSKSNGTPDYSKNIETLQSLVQFETGLRAMVTSTDAPYIQDQNSLFYIITSQLAYLFQSGIPEWDSQTEYFSGKSLVLKSGNIYISTANSTNIEPEVTAGWKGYWLCLTEYQIPVGAILPYGGTSIPTGFFGCDGSAISRTDYARLFDKIGTTYGTGDGSTTFNIPDFTNKTFWGGTTSNVGTVKSAGLPNITGGFDADNNYDMNPTNGCFYNVWSDDWSHATLNTGKGAYTYFDASRSNAIYGNSDTVQPPSIQVPFIIKY